MAENLSSAQESQAGILPKVQKIFCLFLILLGTFLCLERYLATDISILALIAAAGVSAVMAEIMCRGKIQKFITFLLFLLFCGMFLVRNRAMLTEGGKEIANQVIRQVNQHYQTEYLYWFVEQKGEGKDEAILLLCLLLGGLESFFVSLFQKKRSRNGALLSIPLLALTAGILIGRTPSSEGLLLILTGFLAYQLDWKIRGTWILGTGMAMILVLAGVFTKSSMTQKILETYHAPWLQRQIDFENQMLELAERFGDIKLFSTNQVQKEYLLTNEEPNQTGKEVFQITMDKRPEQNIYIRGFIGGDYEGGSWKSVSGQEFSDWAGAQGLSNQKCQQAVQNFPYWKLKKQETNGRTARQVTMELKTAVSGYTLVPYYTRIPEHQSARGDGALVPGSENMFQWDSFLFTESWQQGFFTLGEWQQAEDMDMPEEEEIWESYDSYVQQVYTRLPEQGLKRLRKLAEAYEEVFLKGQQEAALEMENESGQATGEDIQIAVDEIWQKSQQTLELLWQNADYSQKLEPLPEGEDYAEYFLLKQKKGFCVHFATAGTLVLRMYDVPARYVSGYIVFPEDFKENSDGTFTAVVKDERGHAWTEIFQEETGFYPLEMTPPTYFTSLKELQPGESVEDAIQKWRDEEITEVHEEEQETEPEREDISQKPEQPQSSEKEERLEKAESQTGKDNSKENAKTGKKENITIYKAGIGIGICLAAVVLILLLYGKRKRQEERRRAEFFQEDASKGALAMGRSMKQMLESLGLGQKKDMSDLEYGAFLEQELPGMEWERMIFLLQKAAFSEYGITEEEFQAVVSVYEELEQKVRNSKL